jgi:class 3 adenylate cyclase/tetratricopeptide (TPR) repeat protein
MRCPKCQFENREGVKFCEECGANFDQSCPSCSAKIPLGRKFCGECGLKLIELSQAPAINYSEPQSYTPKFLADKILTTRSSLEGERKLVTVLFADVANFTTMAENLDPEDVHQIMDGCFKILIDEIHNYEGTINQFTGDGVMAIFGAPVAHEDHAQRACYAALSIQRALLDNYSGKIMRKYGVEFKMRIGLNSGPVVVGAIGDDLRMDYTAVGDTTNLASRIESRAEPGRILISGATHNLTKDFFEFQSSGKIEIKGKERPQEVYKLIKAGEIENRIRASIAKGLTKFVGRKNSMAVIKQTYQRVITGSGQILGIVGEAGVGKSRFLLEFVNQLPQGQFTYIEASCMHYGSGMAYLPILDILRFYFDIKEGDKEYLVKEKLCQKIQQLDQRLTSVLPSFQELLSVKVDDEKYPKLDPQQKKIRTFESIRDLLLRESEQKPLVLAIEDLHWIDKTSEECISYIVDWLANKCIMLILLYRPEYIHQFGNKSYYGKIGLTQLGADSGSQLVHALLEGGEVIPELRELILKRAGGNPLFVEEFTHSLVENGLIQKKGHQFVLTRKVSEIEVPVTIQGIIAARIDRIEENLKRVMQMASVIGREFAFRILNTIMGIKEELKTHLLNLQGLEFISEKNLFPELEYIFKHALIQEVAYNSLLHTRRKEIHEQIGLAIENLYSERLDEYYELLAYHYGRSNNMDKALRYLDLANQKVAKLNAMAEAKVYFEESMTILDSLPDTKENRQRRISILVNQGSPFLLLLKTPEYYDLLTHYESIAVGLENPELLGALYARMGDCEFSFGNYDQSIRSLTKAAQLAEAAGNVEEAGYAYLRLQWSNTMRGNFERVLALNKDILRMMEKRFNFQIYTYSVPSRAFSYMGLWEEALNEGRKTLQVAEESSDNSLISWSSWNLSYAYTLKGDLARGIEYAERAVEKAPTPADKAWAQRTLAMALCRSGEPKRGVELLNAVSPIFRTGGFTSSEIPLTCHLAEGYWLAGEYHNAKRTLENGLETIERCGARYYLGYALRILGEVTLKTDSIQAKNHFEKSIAVLKKIKAENELALAYAGYGRLYLQQGNKVEARGYLNKALKIFERLGTLIEPEKIRGELAEIPIV